MLKARLNSFSYISDIHLEKYSRDKFRNVKLLEDKKITDTLFLAGDIGNPFEENYQEFLRICSYRYENIFLMSGNHEYWNKYGIEKTDEEIRKNLPSNIFYVKNSIVEMENAFVLGCVLWSHIIGKEGVGKGDDNILFRGQPLKQKGLNELHRKDVIFLENSLFNLLDTNKKVIVLTHFAPSYQMCIPKYQKSPFRNRFYTNLEHLISNPITQWICGHSHSTITRTINGVPVSINAGIKYDEHIFNKCKVSDKS